MTRHYLDHASTSPARPGVVEAMLPWLSSTADPGRVHSEGRAARVAIEEAREQVAALLGARPREVVFTSGGTEAANAAVWGAIARDGRPDAHVVCPAIEHSCVRDASARHAVSYVGVDRLGRVGVADLLDAISTTTALVNLQWGNHEVGTLQPVAELAGACRERDVLLHVDAAQAAGRVPLDFGAVGIDLMSVSAHKMGGPTGIGALLVRQGLRVTPMVVGGEQERARRAGMENVAAIVGFGAAAAAVDIAAEEQAARALTSALLDVALGVPGVTALGAVDDRLPHIVCVAVDGLEAEPVLLGLDQAGIAAHSGSSCSSESLEPSPVLEAMGVDAERSLRLSVGWSSTDADVAAFASSFHGVVERLRALGG